MKTMTFSEGFNFFFKAPKRLLNFLVLLIPIFGFFVLIGYVVKILKRVSEKTIAELPELDMLPEFKNGFELFFKMLPGLLVLTIIGFFSIFLLVVGVVAYIILVPILFMNFFNKQSVLSLMDFDILKIVFNNFKNYFISWLKGLALFAVFFFITLIITSIVELIPGILWYVIWFCINIIYIPLVLIAYYLFIADFYREYISENKLVKVTPKKISTKKKVPNNNNNNKISIKTRSNKK